MAHGVKRRQGGGDDQLRLIAADAEQEECNVAAGAAVFASLISLTGFEPHHYLAPCTSAVFVYAMLAPSLQQTLICTLGFASLFSLGYHQSRRKDLPHSQDTELALVTGASSGIGMEIARELAKKRFDIILVARRESRLKELEVEIRQNAESDKPINVYIYTSDLGQPAEVDKLYAKLARDKLNVTLLINNAGIGHTAEFCDAPLAKLEELVNLNCLAVMKLSRLYAGEMARRGRGRIMTVSSIAGGAPGPLVAAYSASKAFVTSLSQALQHELEPKGITVTTLIPGATFSEFQARSESHGAHAFRLPGMAMTSEAVAKAGVDGMLRGRSIVVPGLVNQWYLTAIQWLPPKLVRRLTSFAWDNKF